MQRQPVYQAQMPEGAERYGVSPTSQQSALVPSYMNIPGVQPAPPSGVPYGLQERCTAITSRGEACSAPKSKESQFCIGHLRQLEKLQREGNEGGMQIQPKEVEE